MMWDAPGVDDVKAQKALVKGLGSFILEGKCKKCGTKLMLSRATKLCAFCDPEDSRTNRAFCDLLHKGHRR